MSLFKDMLKAEESLFKNEIALDFNFLPKLLPYREEQQKHMAYCIKPLLSKKNGKNLFLFGKPGIGKTAAMRFVLKDLEEESDEVIPIYINCWEKNTTFKIVTEICELLNFKFIQNKKSDELIKMIKAALNKKSVVFAFDEVDKMEDYDFLYSILEEIYRKSIFLITNNKEWLLELEQRVRSRLSPDTLEFKPYNSKETEGILKQRLEYAFVPGVWDPEAFNIISEKAAKLEDIRQGLYLLKEAADIAESKSSKKINSEHARLALSKLDNFSVKKSTDLEEDERFILSIIKKNSGKKMGDLYKVYEKVGGKCSYKSFQRKVKRISANGFLSLNKTEGGKKGNITIVDYKKEETKKLTEF